MLFRALPVLSCITTCLCKIYEKVSDLPGLEYDFLIIGGGTAGLVVANRLTENPKFSVLVLEAGVSSEGVLDSIIPFFITNLLGRNIYDWNYTTIPQPGLNGRVLDYFRGHLLGGCSAHNDMLYTRGTKDDFNRYAKLTGDPGWSWDRIFPYFLKNEKWTPPTDLHDKFQFDPSVHSTHGTNPVSLPGSGWPLGPRVLQATKELPDEFPFNLDINSGRPLGIGWAQSTNGGGKRSSSASAYLAPEFAQRRNLHVLLHAQVSKLVDHSYVGGKLVFSGIKFWQPGSSQFVAKASKEIIISAGTVGTPHILMNSGVGDKTALIALGIPSLLDLPSLGRNVSDHPGLDLAYFVNSTQTVESITQNTTAFNEAFVQWNATHTGPFVDLAVSHIGGFRLDPESPIFAQYPDPSAGPNTPHLEFVFEAGLAGLGPFAIPEGHLMGIGISVVTPLSRGSVTLNSSNPLGPPLIDPGYLTSDFDLFAVRDGLKRAQRFVTAPVWKDYILAPAVDLESLTSDALDQFIRNNTSPMSHLVGSAGMSARGARYGVVDPDLRVKGARGLRIIGASVLPVVPAAHTQAGTYVIAERGADLVKASWT
ncbi:pyranose dehydrogenase [Mycena vulgaris]|nr:pyranose dehydrogenase [Mycena vulgaris]